MLLEHGLAGDILEGHVCPLGPLVPISPPTFGNGVVVVTSRIRGAFNLVGFQIASSIW